MSLTCKPWCSIDRNGTLQLQGIMPLTAQVMQPPAVLPLLPVLSKFVSQVLLESGGERLDRIGARARVRDSGVQRRAGKRRTVPRGLCRGGTRHLQAHPGTSALCRLCPCTGCDPPAHAPTAPHPRTWKKTMSEKKEMSAMVAGQALAPGQSWGL